MTLKILLVGKDSQIGSYFFNHYPGISIGTTRRKDEQSRDSKSLFLDLSDDISQWLPPDNIHCAIILSAVTSIDVCKSDMQLSRFINIDQTIKLIKILKEDNIFIIFPSTNLVFNGDTPFQKSDDIRTPVTAYGKMKAEMETFILENHIQGSIVRFSKIISPDNKLIISWIHNLKTGIKIYPFYDMYLSPIPISIVCNVLYQIAEKHLPGIIQVSGNEDISYADLAFYISRKLGYDYNLIEPVSWRNSGIDLETVPLHTTLNTARLRDELGISIPDICTTIDLILHENSYEI
jgi:dTDP-4-dehydrorhamnose reductase